MRRFILAFAVALLAVSPLSAQRLMVGDRAPEVKGKWLANTPNMNGKTVMVEFFHSSNKYSVARLEQLDKMARDSRGKLVVVVVTRENSPAVTSRLTQGGPAYYPLLDDGSTFSAYKVQFVPYSVIYDRKGRVVWLGNPSSLSNEQVMQFMR